MKTHIFVDNSNTWIEGQHVSAVRRRLAADIYDAQRNDICDRYFRMDFGRLLDVAGGYDRSRIGQAVLVGSRPPDSDSIWNAARRQGFDVITFDRVHGREKKVDTSLATLMVTSPIDMGLDPRSDRFTLVAGDRDFVPPVEKLITWGYRVTVAFWDHAALELKQAATEFRSLNRLLNLLSLDRVG